MNRGKTMTNQTFVPVIIGSNKGSYSTARAIHEAYDVKSEMILRLDLGATAHSSIMNKHIYDNLLDSFPNVMENVKRRIDDKYPDLPKIIIGSDDWFVEQVITHRHIFEGWTVPYVSKSIHDRAVDKSNFYNICQAHDIPHPETYSIEKDIADLAEDRPYVVKAANTPVYQNLDFEGKEKVFLCSNKSEAIEAIKLIQKAGYKEEIVFQEFLELKPLYQGSVTIYRSPHDRQVKMICFGRVIVEDPMPESLGNNLVIFTERGSQKVYTDSVKLMEALDWTGFANFDLIYDERTEEFKFLEINPRLGMTNYYATAAGVNVARYYVEDYIFKRAMELEIGDKETLFTSIPKLLVKHEAGHTSYWPKIKEAYQSHEVYNAFSYSKDNHWRRRLYVFLNEINYIKKFRSIGRL